jgi:predicted dinucleotide-binding enzyme
MFGSYNQSMTKIAVLGTGAVGTTLAAELAAAGHDVALGTRDPEATRARMQAGANGASLLGPEQVRLATFEDAAGGAELVFLATSGTVALEVLRRVGPERLEGKVLVDVANPIDVSAGFPLAFTVCGDDSLGEQLQRAFPGAKVVKALNMIDASLMTAPDAVGGDTLTMFVSGDDVEAKARVVGILKADFGWKDVFDLGDITGARAMEMMVSLWGRVFMTTGSGRFGFRLVR